MEKSNGIVRSEVWNKIYDIVTTLPRTEGNGMDAPDAPSVTTSIEQLFLKLFAIHGVVKSFYCEVCNGDGVFEPSDGFVADCPRCN